MKISDKHTRILLIEDNLGYVRLIQKILTLSNQVEYQIECADHLSAGLEYLVKGEIDVVLLDLGLPDSQGLDTLGKVHAQAPAVPIVVVTGLDDETLAVQAVRQGAQDYLVKGDIDSKTLWRVIRYAVERKQAEEKIKQTASEWRITFDSITDLVSIHNRDFKLTRINKAFADFCKMKPEELIGKTCYEIVHGANKPPFNCPHKRGIETKKPSVMEYLEPHLELYLEVAASPIFNEKGEVVACVHIVRDITERRKMQAQLVQTEKMSALGTMAAGVAHELLNPMMGMLNFTQYCLKHTAEGDSRYPVLQDMERETRRCADIVGNLTTFSRIGKQDEGGYQKESFTIIIDRVVKLLSYRIEKEHVLLTQHVAENTPKIWMEVNSMQQVLLNLISNALDALMESQKKEIHIEVYREDDFVQLIVTDSGCGLAPENLEKIYDPFFTTKPIGQGTGLGLTTSRSIIESHGGDITCESKLGVGTIFKVLLPAKTKGGEK